MTAEIGILNKSAVALAADSAVTMEAATGTKIYNTVNKLFALTKCHPVGIMIYGNAELNGVPWETLIKVYREHLSTRKFRRLSDYADHFLSFLNGRARELLKPGERDYVRSIVRSFLYTLKKEFLEEVDKYIESSKKTITRKKASVILDSLLKADLSRFSKARRLQTFRKHSVLGIVRPFGAEIAGEVTDIFQQFKLSDKQGVLVHRIAGLLLVRDLFNRAHQAGVVIAGFGHDEHYPALFSYEVEGFIANKLKVRLRNKSIITNDDSVFIVPFAQSEMVHTFMEGIDPDLLSSISDYLTNIIVDLPATIVDELKKNGAKVSNKSRGKLVRGAKKNLAETLRALELYRQMNHVQPVVAATRFLPKDELAAMAAALVNLTSFRRRVSLDAETVGGPIDVAVISKGDGFIWIKRKHYFDKELNPDFFLNQERRK